MGLKKLLIFSLPVASIWVFSCAVPKESLQQEKPASSNQTRQVTQLNQTSNVEKSVSPVVTQLNNTAQVVANVTATVGKSMNTTTQQVKNFTSTATAVVEKSLNNTSQKVQSAVKNATSRVETKQSTGGDIKDLIEKYAVCVFTKGTPCVHSTPLGLLEFTAPKRSANCTEVDVKFKPKKGSEKDFKVLKCGNSLKVLPLN